MLVREVMTSPVVSVYPQEPLAAAIHLLDRHTFTALPVVDDRGRLVGIVSEADVLGGEPSGAQDRDAGGGRDRRIVADVMTTRVISAREDSDVADVTEVMLQTGVKSVPVVRGGVVVGLVSRHDVIHAEATLDDRIRAQLEELLAAAGLDGWTATVDDGMVVLSGHGSEGDVRLVMRLARTVPGVDEVHVSSLDAAGGRAVADDEPT